MAITEFTAALNQVASERNIKPEDVLATLEDALIAAYRKDHPVEDEDNERFKVDVASESGEVKIYYDGKDVTPAGFGRIASQTAKQVILQKIREAEKESIANEYRELIGTIVQGYIFRIDKETVIMDLGKTQGILPPSEKIQREPYSVNQKYKVLVKDVSESDLGTGSNIILSRRDPLFIEELFKQEVPEMAQGTVKIESIAREAGERTKIAVSSSDEKVDPSGACIGQRGIRVQAVTDELGGEKIDIINYNPDPDRFIAAALAPAHVLDVVLDREAMTASVQVADDQQSLAIGNKGQNARLAAKLTGWKLTVEGNGENENPVEAEVEVDENADAVESDESTEVSTDVDSQEGAEVSDSKTETVEEAEEKNEVDTDGSKNESDASTESEEGKKSD